MTNDGTAICFQADNGIGKDLWVLLIQSNESEYSQAITFGL